MKKIKKPFGLLFRVLSLLLIFVMSATIFASCAASKGEPMLRVGSATVSVNEYALLLSRMKGALARVYQEAVKDSFWDTTIGLDGTTYNDYFTAQVLDTARTYAIALYLFDEYDLELPKEMIEDVDEKMEGLLVGDGDGSKSQLNQILSAYNMNYEMLREFYITEQKVDQLRAYLYGANGGKITAGVKEEYMQENYVCFKQIFLASYYYIYEKDAYGNTIYYDDDGKTYLYDTENGVTMTDDNGEIKKDKNGDEIFFDAEGNILYDKEKGTPMYVTDKDGNYKTEDYSKEELEKIKANVELLQSQIENGDVEEFEDLMHEYSEDEEGIEEYENGYFLEKNTTYGYAYLTDISEALAEMEIGEIRLVESDRGFHLIMKYECPVGAYADRDNAVWFSEFNTSLIEYLFLQETAKYKDEVELDEELLSKVDMKSAAINYYY